MITVLDLDSLGSEPEGDADVVRFLNADTVGAERVQGSAYRLHAGGRTEPLAAQRYQLFYVTGGRPVALYQGQRHQLKPATGVYCEPGEACRFENPGGEPASFYRFVV